jgi:hypothetical protein
VIIGISMDKEDVKCKLDACLLTDEEFALGPYEWINFEDRWDDWDDEAEEEEDCEDGEECEDEEDGEDGQNEDGDAKKEDEATEKETEKA